MTADKAAGGDAGAGKVKAKQGVEGRAFRILARFFALTAIGSIPVAGSFAGGVASGLMAGRSRRWVQIGFVASMILLALVTAAFLLVGAEIGFAIGGSVYGHLGALLCAALGFIIGGIIGVAILGNLFLFALGAFIGGTVRTRKKP